jgi:xylulokinase
VVEKAEIDPSGVLGLSLAGQMHGTVCVDASGTPVRPAIIWADQRSQREVDWVMGSVSCDDLARWIGNPLATGFMLLTWLWLRAHEPKTMALARWLMLPKDYVRYRLTGEIGAEPSDAASTALFSPAERTWSKPLLAALQLEERVLPSVGRSTDVAGGLLPGPAGAMGLPAGVPVVFGGSDQAVQALGNGVVAPGWISSTIGTGGQLFAPTERPTVDAPALRLHSYCHVAQDVWHVETAMLSAGLSLRWLRDQVLEGLSYDDLAGAAMAVPAGADSLLFQPYLIGERTPHMDPNARGGFVGLTRRHGVGHLARAVMEGVVHSMREGLDLLVDLGVPVDHVVASGGATSHPLWLQLQADIYNRPILRARVTEAAATGAAMLAGIGVGVYQDAQDAIETVVRWHDKVTAPDAGRVAVYQELHQLYAGLYPALVDSYHALGAYANKTTGQS